MITGKKILIFGGTGSLGNKIINRYLSTNTIVNYSRDENKHWKMQMKYKNPNLSFIIGDIRNYDRVQTAILRENPNIIIIAAALKHIDRCELAVSECVATNFQGPQNVIDSIEANIDRLTNLECCLFVSTDKACSPINTYGKSKALAESAIISGAYNIPSVKFVTIRYGNVLNSRGSILKILHHQGKDPNVKEFTLTSELATRFVMTLEQSVDLMEHAIIYGESGDIVIPTLVSMNVKDLFEIFSEKYNKPIKIVGLRQGEKLLESLINETQAMSLVKGDNYMYIKPFYKNHFNPEGAIDYNSTINPLSKSELKSYLTSLNFI